MLTRSFNRDAEADLVLYRDRQERMDINSEEKRRNRQNLVELADP